MMKKTLPYLLLIVVIAGILGVYSASNVSADIIDNIRGSATNFNTQVTNLPDGGDDPVQLIGRIITYLLGFLGIVFLILVIWGGLQWMLSGGDPKKVESARKRITSAAIGIAVIVLSLAIVQFVLMILGKTTGIN